MRAVLAGLILVGAAAARTHGPYATGFHPQPQTHGRYWIQRSVRSHGRLPLWDRIRDLELHVVRTRRDPSGEVLETVREVQRIVKGRRPRVRIERRLEGGELVLGLDGRRAWALWNGARLHHERALAEAEEATRWADFVARLPYVLGEDDARSRAGRTGFFAGGPSVSVDVRFLHGTRPSEEDFTAHLHPGTFRLRGLEFRSHRTPGTEESLELDRWSTFEGIWFPMRRTRRRADAQETLVERIQGMRVNQGPPLYLFRPPR